MALEDDEANTRAEEKRDGSPGPSSSSSFATPFMRLRDVLPNLFNRHRPVRSRSRSIYGYQLGGGRSGSVSTSPPNRCLHCDTILPSATDTESHRCDHSLNVDTSRKPDDISRATDTADVVADLFYFDITKKEWICVSKNTTLEGGPQLVYDHGMCIDSEAQKLYIGGGRIVSSKEERMECQYGGLFEFDIAKQEWKELRSAAHGSLPPEEPFLALNVSIIDSDESESHSDKEERDKKKKKRKRKRELRARFGHVMEFEPESKSILIIGGRVQDTMRSSFLRYHVPSDTVETLAHNTSSSGGPFEGFNLRSSFDVESQTLFIMSGVSVEVSNRRTVSSMDPTDTTNHIWAYSVKNGKWRHIFNGDCTEPGIKQPCSRFAHAFVYSSCDRKLYAFGGNPLLTTYPKQRLNDMFSLSVHWPSPQESLDRAAFLLRKQKYLEMLQRGDYHRAVVFLRVIIFKFLFFCFQEFFNRRCDLFLFSFSHICHFSFIFLVSFPP